GDVEECHQGAAGGQQPLLDRGAHGRVAPGRHLPRRAGAVFAAVPGAAGAGVPAGAAHAVAAEARAPRTVPAGAVPVVVARAVPAEAAVVLPVGAHGSSQTSGARPRRHTDVLTSSIQ